MSNNTVEQLGNTETETLPTLLRRVADGMELDPKRTLTWKLYNGKVTVAAFSVEDRVYVHISERQYLEMDRNLASTLGWNLVWAAGDAGVWVGAQSAAKSNDESI